VRAVEGVLMSRQPTVAVPLEVAKLEEGMNRVVLDVGASSFELEWPQTTFDGDVHVEIDVVRMLDDLQIDARFAGGFTGTCDRCLETFTGQLEGELRVLGRKGDAASHELGGEDGIVFYGGPIVDLTGEIRQGLLLGLPMRMLCSPECRGLCPRCGVNRNVESCTCTVEGTNPRWAALERLRDRT